MDRNEGRTRQEYLDPFYGNSVKSRVAGPFVLTERAYPPGFHTPTHVHIRPLFCVVLEGSYCEVHGRKERVCRAGTLLFHAAQEEHLERFGDFGGRSLIVEIDPSWLEQVFERPATGLQQTTVIDAEILRGGGARLYREFLSKDQTSTLILEGLLLEMTGEFLRVMETETHREPFWLNKARDLIRSNFRSTITVSFIASAVGVHPVHLAQTFRKYFSSTIGDYVRSLRVEFACDQLSSTDFSLSEIASAAGFADQSHFTRTFKRITGVSPSHYRAGILRNQ